MVANSTTILWEMLCAALEENGIFPNTDSIRISATNNTSCYYETTLVQRLLKVKLWHREGATHTVFTDKAVVYFCCGSVVLVIVMGFPSL